MRKDLALKISKHPMIKKLMESVDKKDVARLIAEELMNEGDDEVNKYETLINNAESLEELQNIKNQIDSDTKVTSDDKVVLQDIIDTAKEDFKETSPAGEETDTPDEKEEPETGEEQPSEPTDEPEKPTEPSADSKEQPDKFDLDDEQQKELKEAAKNFINEFYEQQYLFQQGQIVKALLTVLLKIKSGEEKELAARSIRTREKIQEQEEDKLEASKDRLRSIQISFRTFLRDIKVAKQALKKFQEVADKGSIVASSAKKKFIKLLQRQQRDIATLFNALTDAYIKRLDEAEASKGETELKWERIEKNYDEASEKLRSLLGLSGDGNLRNSIALIDDIISALRELTKEFPNVNPFGRKDDDYDQFGDEYDSAIEDVKSVSLQPILELTRTGSGSELAVEGALRGLKEFSQQIEAIFGVKSQFGGAPKKKDRAAQPDTERPKTTGEPEEVGFFDKAVSKLENYMLSLLADRFKSKRTDTEAMERYKEEVKEKALEFANQEYELADKMMKKAAAQNVAKKNTQEFMEFLLGKLNDIIREPLSESFMTQLIDRFRGSDSELTLSNVFTGKVEKYLTSDEGPYKDSPETIEKLKQHFRSNSVNKYFGEWKKDNEEKALKILTSWKISSIFSKPELRGRKVRDIIDSVFKPGSTPIPTSEPESSSTPEPSDTEPETGEDPGGELQKMKEYLEPLVGKYVLFDNTFYTLRGIITPEDGNYVKKYKEIYKDVDPKLESFQEYLENTEKSKRIAICLFDSYASTITVEGDIKNLDDLKRKLKPESEVLKEPSLDIIDDAANEVEKEIKKDADGDAGIDREEVKDVVKQEVDRFATEEEYEDLLNDLDKKDIEKKVFQKVIDDSEVPIEPPNAGEKETSDVSGDKEVAPYRPQSQKEAQTYVIGQIDEMSGAVDGIDDSQRRAASLFVNGFLNKLHGYSVKKESKDEISQEFPDHSKTIMLILSKMKKESREAFEQFRKNMKKAGKYDEFKNLMRSIIKGAPSAGEEEPKAEETAPEQIVNDLEAIEDLAQEVEMPQKLAKDIETALSFNLFQSNPIRAKLSKLMLEKYKEAIKLQPDYEALNYPFIATLTEMIDELKGIQREIKAWEESKNEAEAAFNHYKEELEKAEPTKTRERIKELAAEHDKRQIQLAQQGDFDLSKIEDERIVTRMKQQYADLEKLIDSIATEHDELLAADAFNKTQEEKYAKWEQKLQEESKGLAELEAKIENIDTAFDFISKFKEKLTVSLEEQIANKLKPLIKEQLRRSK